MRRVCHGFPIVKGIAGIGRDFPTRSKQRRRIHGFGGATRLPPPEASKDSAMTQTGNTACSTFFSILICVTILAGCARVALNLA